MGFLYICVYVYIRTFLIKRTTKGTIFKCTKKRLQSFVFFLRFILLNYYNFFSLYFFLLSSFSFFLYFCEQSCMPPYLREILFITRRHTTRNVSPSFSFFFLISCPREVTTLRFLVTRSFASSRQFDSRRWEKQQITEITRGTSRANRAPSS